MKHIQEAASRRLEVYSTPITVNPLPEGLPKPVKVLRGSNINPDSLIYKVAQKDAVLKSLKGLEEFELLAEKPGRMSFKHKKTRQVIDLWGSTDGKTFEVMLRKPSKEYL